MREAITKNDAGLNRSKAVPSRLCKQNDPMTVDRQMRLISTHVTLYHVNLPEQPLVSAIFLVVVLVVRRPIPETALISKAR